MADRGNHKRTIQHLAQQLRRLGRGDVAGEVVSTGIAEIDNLLPERGIPPGTLVEWLSHGAGTGAGTVAFLVAANVIGENGVCVVIDERREFSPPGAASWLHALDRLLVVHPANVGDALWALEQSLRCSGVAVVVSWIDAISNRVYRRLQLAVETGGGIGLLLRPAEYRSQPSWAGMRLLVEPLPAFSRRHPNGVFAGRRLRMELVHCRGRLSGGTRELEIDDETGDVRVAPVLAAATDSRHAAGA